MCATRLRLFGLPRGLLRMSIQRDSLQRLPSFAQANRRHIYYGRPTCGPPDRARAEPKGTEQTRTLPMLSDTHHQSLFKLPLPFFSLFRILWLFFLSFSFSFSLFSYLFLSPERLAATRYIPILYSDKYRTKNLSQWMVVGVFAKILFLLDFFFESI